jgi:hypothetical protein
MYKILESLQIRLIKYPMEIEPNIDILRTYFTEILVQINKTLFDYIMSWLINFYYKIDAKEKDFHILNLFLKNVITNKYVLRDLNNKFNFEDNFYYKVLINKFESIDTLSRIHYVCDLLEKKSGASEKSLPGIKNKNKKIIENLVKVFGRNVVDYYLIVIFYLVKSNPNRIEIDSQKNGIKIALKKYEDSSIYLYDIMILPFNYNLGNGGIRKLVLFINLILLKTLGLPYLHKIIKVIQDKILNKFQFTLLITNLEFKILEEFSTYNYQGIDTSKGFTKALENLLYDMIGTHNLRPDDKNKELFDMKVCDRLGILRNFIILFEKLIDEYIKELKNFNLNNLKAVYNFYNSIQYKFIANFTYFQDLLHKKYLETQVKIGNLSKVLPIYNNNHSEIDQIISELLGLMYGNTSLIYHNWLIFILKNGTVIDAYKTIKIVLLTKKEGAQIYFLLNLQAEVSKFYPYLWK